MNRYDYMNGKKKPSPAQVGQIWRQKADKGLYIRLDKRLVQGHNVVVWDAIFNVWGTATPTQITETMLLDEYEIHDKGTDLKGFLR